MDEDLKARKIFVTNLKRYAERYGKTQADITAYIGCSASTTSDWFNGRKYPRPDKMQQLADFFGIVISDLTKEYTAEMDDILIACYGDVKADLTDDDIDDIIVAMQAKAERNKRRKSGE